MKKDVYTNNNGEEVQCTQVDRDNYVQQSTWCNGQITMNSDGIFYVNVRNSQGTKKAYERDWIVKIGGEFFVYSNISFKDIYTLKDSREGGNDDNQSDKQTPRSQSTKIKVKDDHGHVIRGPEKR